MQGIRLLALLFVVALVAAACGDSADTRATTAAPEATTATTQPPPTTESPATTQPPATTQATTTTTVEVAPTGPETISFEGLIGTWRGLGTGSNLQFNEDGTYRIFTVYPGAEDLTVEQGRFTLEGTLFTFVSNEDSQNCAAGQRGSYELEVLEVGPADEDRLKQIQVEDECIIRGSVGDVTLERLTAAPEREYVFYEDPENDCRNLGDNTPAPACMPASADILSVELTRAGPLTIVIEIAAPGEPELGTDYSMEIGVDTDRDAATGSRGWRPGFIGPELEFDYFVRGGEVSIEIYQYMPDGNVFGVSTGAEWEWLDATHLQVVIEALVGDGPFWIVGDLTTGNHHDPFANGGHLLFPEGDVELVG